MTPEELDAVLARIAAGTETLRTAGDAAGEIARQLIADLAHAAAQLREDATAIGQSLAGALDVAAAGVDEADHEP